MLVMLRFSSMFAPSSEVVSPDIVDSAPSFSPPTLASLPAPLLIVALRRHLQLWQKISIICVIVNSGRVSSPTNMFCLFWNTAIGFPSVTGSLLKLIASPITVQLWTISLTCKSMSRVS